MAPAQQARAGREGLGDRATRQARLPRREPVLVVRDGRDDRPDGHAAAHLPRRRAQVARLLHVPAPAPRQPDRAAGRVPAVSVLGPDGEHQVDGVDRGRRQDRARQRATRPAAGLPAAPRLRPPAVRPGRSEALQAARELDEVAGSLVDHARARGDQVVVPQRVRDHRRAPAGRDQPRPAPRRAAERLHPGRDGVPRSVDVEGLCGRRPPDRARLHGSSRCRGARGSHRARRHRRAARRAPTSRAPASRTSGPGSWSPWPSATPGSRTTTGSTTSAPRTSAARSRSTASRATTRPSCSSTPTTSEARSSAAGSLWRARRSACGTCCLSLVWTRHGMCVARTGCCPTRRSTRRCSCARRGRSPGHGLRDGRARRVARVGRGFCRRPGGIGQRQPIREARSASPPRGRARLGRPRARAEGSRATMINQGRPTLEGVGRVTCHIRQ